MHSQILKILTLSVLLFASSFRDVQAAPCPFNWVGEPDIDGSIADIKAGFVEGLSPSAAAELSNYSGDQDLIDNLFFSIIQNESGQFLFSSPINTIDDESARTLGDAYFGSGWFSTGDRTFIHRGLDLAVNANVSNAETPIKVMSISEGVLYVSKDDVNESNIGDYIVIKHPLDPDQFYPMESIVSWQNAAGEQIDPANPPADDTDVFPSGSRIERFLPKNSDYKFLYILYLHLKRGEDIQSTPVPNQDMAAAQHISKGQALGYLKKFPGTDVHLHIQSMYATDRVPDLADLFSGISHYNYGSIKDKYGSDSPEWQLDNYFTPANGDDCKRPSHTASVVPIDPILLLYWLKTKSEDLAIKQSRYENGELILTLDVPKEFSTDNLVALAETRAGDSLDLNVENFESATNSLHLSGQELFEDGSLEVQLKVPGTNPSIETTERVPFRDVANNIWYEDFVIQLWKRNIVTGREPGIFKPDDDVTRVELLKMIIGAIGEKCGVSSASLENCRNTPAGTTPWYSYCLTADEEISDKNKSLRIAFWLSPECQNNEYGVCCPYASCPELDNRAATRADATRMLAVGASPESWPDSLVVPANSSGPAFLGDIPNFLAPFANFLNFNNMIHGYLAGHKDAVVPMFRPADNINRAEIAKIISEGIEHGEFQCRLN